MPVLQTRVSDEEIKEIQSFAKMKGMTTSALVRESVVSYIAKNTPVPSFGCMTGKIWIADDFDALPEGFEEYV